MNDVIVLWFAAGNATHMILYNYVDLFGFSEKYTRFCQWKNLELNIQVSGNISEVYRMFMSPMVMYSFPSFQDWLFQICGLGIPISRI